MLLQTHCFIAKATMAMTANIGDYELDSGILAIEDIFLASGTTNYLVRRSTTTDLMNRRLFAISSSTVQRYAVNGANMLMVYPTPTQADSLTVYYVPRPSVLSVAGDDPATKAGIPSEFHYGLELYMQWKAGDAFDDASSNQGETYRREYLGDPTAPPGTPQRYGFIGKMKRDLRGKGGKHLAEIQIPPRNRRNVIPSPGTDVGSLY